VPKAKTNSTRRIKAAAMAAEDAARTLIFFIGIRAQKAELDHVLISKSVSSIDRFVDD
jgi:hypothetical protein